MALTNVGRIHEEQFAKRIGGKLVPQSGAGWSAKLDVGKGRSWIFSCKATSHASLRLTDDIMREAIDYANSLGDAMPAVSVELNSGTGKERRLIVLDEDDFLALASGEVELVLTPDEKVAQKWARANLPQMLRDADDDD